MYTFSFITGNAAYGKTATNLCRHKDVSFCGDAKASRKANSPFFRHLTPITDTVFEVEMKKKTIRFNLPHQIAFFVYQYAKLRMLQFYYDCIDKFIPREMFEYSQMDTDSAYMGLASDRLEKLVRPELMEQFLKEKDQWFPRTDTEENAAFDKRRSGLMKLEFSGSFICALSSKTYFCLDDDNKPKITCKGVRKANNEITKETYLNVLFSKKSGSGVNKGFRMHREKMHTYIQKRDAFSYLYPKRKVLPDGITTTPLDI